MEYGIHLGPGGYRSNSDVIKGNLDNIKSADVNVIRNRHGHIAAQAVQEISSAKFVDPVISKYSSNPEITTLLSFIRK